MKNNSNQRNADNLNGQRIMLIGGAGFIGHHLALELRKQNASVTVIDNLQINNIVQILNDIKLTDKKRNFIHKLYFGKV